MNRFPYGSSGSISGALGVLYRRTWEGNLLRLDWDTDFLEPSVRKQWSGGYVGLGKTYEALSRMASATGNRDLLDLRSHVLDTLLDARDPDGYAGAFVPSARYVRLWDVHELAYLTLSFLTDAELHGDDRTAAAARAIGELLLDRLDERTLAQAGRQQDMTIAPHLALLGLDRAMTALWRSTGDLRYASFARERLGLEAWNPGIVEGRFEPIDGHVYAYLERSLAQLELGQAAGDESEPPTVRQALAYLLEDRALLASGSCGIEECWHSDQTITGDIGETCATAYLIRLLWKLLRRGAHGRYGDLMERALWNALYAAQSPDGRRLRYYVPLEGRRVYWERDTYCCPGNFRRIVSELPGMIAAGGAGEVMINLYTESDVRVRMSRASAAGVRIEQHTDYPAAGRVGITLTPDEPAEFSLLLRRPSHVSRAELCINDDLVVPSEDRGYLAIRRTWKPGDRITLDLNMPWRWIRGFRKQEGRAVLARGPLLYCLNPDRNTSFDMERIDDWRIDAASVDGPHPAGDLSDCATACRVTAHGGETTARLTLTEFHDPGGTATYVRLGGPAAAEDDELYL